MRKCSWSELLSKLCVFGSPRPPSRSKISAFEEEWGHRLPESYVEFTLVFGAGELGETFLLYSPGCAESAVNLGAEFKAYRRAYARLRKETPRMMDTYDDFEQVERVVVFCTTFGGSKYGWDYTDVTSEAPVEYGIYHAGSGSSSYTKVAESFTEFVFDFCLGDGYLQFFGLKRFPASDKMRESFQATG